MARRKTPRSKRPRKNQTSRRSLKTKMMSRTNRKISQNKIGGSYGVGWLRGGGAYNDISQRMDAIDDILAGPGIPKDTVIKIKGVLEEVRSIITMRKENIHRKKREKTKQAVQTLSTSMGNTETVSREAAATKWEEIQLDHAINLMVNLSFEYVRVADESLIEGAKAKFHQYAKYLYNKGLTIDPSQIDKDVDVDKLYASVAVGQPPRITVNTLIRYLDITGGWGDPTAKRYLFNISKDTTDGISSTNFRLLWDMVIDFEDIRQGRSVIPGVDHKPR